MVNAAPLAVYSSVVPSRGLNSLHGPLVKSQCTVSLPKAGSAGQPINGAWSVLQFFSVTSIAAAMGPERRTCEKRVACCVCLRRHQDGGKGQNSRREGIGEHI